MSGAERIVVTTVVNVDPATAFKVFTTEVDAWWKRGPKFRPCVLQGGVLRFEPGVGGRLLETYEDQSTFLFGRVTAWEPGQRLAFELFARAFRPGESTQVEVRFEAAGNNTQVAVEHRGWERFPAEHPARHGLGESAFSKLMSGWWADLLVAIRKHITDPSTEGSR